MNKVNVSAGAFELVGGIAVEAAKKLKKVKKGKRASGLAPAKPTLRNIPPPSIHPATLLSNTTPSTPSPHVSPTPCHVNIPTSHVPTVPPTPVWPAKRVHF